MAIKLGKHINLSLALLATMAIAGSCSAATNPTTVKTQYQKSSENFANPERGFYVTYATDNTNSSLQLSELQKARSKNITLVRRIYIIPQFRNSALSQSFLDFVSKDCDIARQAGVKLIVRFAYNFDRGEPDAPRDRILAHLEQLQPILKQNKDAIATMEAGFIGSWGEWHTSTNGLDNSENRRTILNKVLSVLPNDRMVALRFPLHKMDAFNNKNPLTPAEAFNSSYRARTGAHNDCFLYDSVDGGTFYDHSGTKINLDPEAIKNYLNLDNRYVVQGGETCSVSSYSNCPNALKEIERQHWTYINSEYEQNVLQGWRDQGCMPQIQQRLGYRFRLSNSTIPDRVKPAGTFSISFQVVNDGWASPFNPRSLEVILRNRQTGKEYYLPVPEAVRMWMPGEAKNVNIVGGIPSSMPPGEYQVLLNLPDPTPKLYGRPQYSIRLANQNVWEASKGYNSLLRNIIVDPNAGGENYSSNQYFKLR